MIFLCKYHPFRNIRKLAPFEFCNIVVTRQFIACRSIQMLKFYSSCKEIFLFNCNFLSFITIFKVRVYVSLERWNTACLLKICIRNVYRWHKGHPIKHICCMKKIIICFLLELNFPSLSQFSSGQQVKLSFVSFTCVHRYSFYWKFHSVSISCWYQRNPFLGTWRHLYYTKDI